MKDVRPFPLKLHLASIHYSRLIITVPSVETFYRRGPTILEPSGQPAAELMLQKYQNLAAKECVKRCTTPPPAPPPAFMSKV